MIINKNNKIRGRVKKTSWNVLEANQSTRKKVVPGRAITTEKLKKKRKRERMMKANTLIPPRLTNDQKCTSHILFLPLSRA